MLTLLLQTYPGMSYDRSLDGSPPYCESGNGGIIFNGDVDLPGTGFSWEGVGGIELKGTAPVVLAFSKTGAGGVVFNGDCNNAFTPGAWVPAGGIVFNGNGVDTQGIVDPLFLPRSPLELGDTTLEAPDELYP